MQVSFDLNRAQQNQAKFLTTVCHCLEQAVLEQRVTPSTASAKQWHTVARSPLAG